MQSISSPTKKVNWSKAFGLESDCSFSRNYFKQLSENYYNTSHKFWDQSPKGEPFINVACKYLRQVLDTSFSAATLPICCNIE